jgi:hypothetical protein
MLSDSPSSTIGPITLTTTITGPVSPASSSGLELAVIVAVRVVNTVEVVISGVGVSAGKVIVGSMEVVLSL